MRSNYAVELYLDLKYIAKLDRDAKNNKDRPRLYCDSQKVNAFANSPMQFFEIISIRSFINMSNCTRILRLHFVTSMRVWLISVWCALTRQNNWIVIIAYKHYAQLKSTTMLSNCMKIYVAIVQHAKSIMRFLRTKLKLNLLTSCLYRCCGCHLIRMVVGILKHI